MGDVFNGILNGMGEIIHGINAPLIACVVVGHAGNTVDNRVPHVDIRGSHIDFGSQHLLPVPVLSFLHLLKQGKILLHGTVPVRTLLAGCGKISPVLPDLVRCQVTDKGLSLLNQEHGAPVHLVKIIGRKEKPVLKISAQPLHVIHDGLHEFSLFLCGVCIVKTQVELAAVLLCQAVVQ